MLIRIGGVPEHFNFPWHYAISKRYFEKAGVIIEWHDFPGGTGAMSNALKTNDIDIAILLTEGAVKEIASGASFKIVRGFVETPLIWGIHSSSKNDIANLRNLPMMKYAISRFGSGSHLMAHVHAYSNGILLQKDQMILVGDLEGARKSLADGETDLFFWERFMTKPLVDSGELKLLGQFPTPWSCFILAAADLFLDNNYHFFSTISEILDKSLDELKQDASLAKTISKRYGLKETDTIEWLSKTEWSRNIEINSTSIKNVIDSLFSVDMITIQPEIRHLLHNNTREI